MRVAIRARLHALLASRARVVRSQHLAIRTPAFAPSAPSRASRRCALRRPRHTPHNPHRVSSLSHDQVRRKGSFSNLSRGDARREHATRRRPTRKPSRSIDAACGRALCVLGSALTYSWSSSGPREFEGSPRRARVRRERAKHSLRGGAQPSDMLCRTRRKATQRCSGCASNNDGGSAPLC